MPPKFAFAIFTPCGSSSIAMTFPGIARHILDHSFFINGTGEQYLSGPAVPFDPLSTHRRHHLPECNPAIVRRHALVPIWPEALLPQPPHGSLGEIFVLKTAARQSDPRHANSPADGYHHLR